MEGMRSGKADGRSAQRLVGGGVVMLVFYPFGTVIASCSFQLPASGFGRSAVGNL